MTRRLALVAAMLLACGLVFAWPIIDPWLTYPIVREAKPAYLVTMTDPTFGTDRTRITGDNGTLISWTGSSTVSYWSNGRPHYSKTQPLDSSGQYLLMDMHDGDESAAGAFLLDATSYLPIKPLSDCAGAGDAFPGNDYRWSPDPNFPHTLVGASGTLLYVFDPVDCHLDRSWTLTGWSIDGIGAGEGNLTDDGRYVLLTHSTQIRVVDLNPYDPNNSRIGPVTDTAPCGLLNSSGLTDCDIDNASINHSGHYAVVMVNDLARVYDADLGTLVLTPHVYDSGIPECTLWSVGHPTGVNPATGSIFSLAHADTGPGGWSGDFIVGQKRSWCPNPPDGNPQSPTVGSVVGVDLGTGAVSIGLTLPRASGGPAYDDKQEAYSHHISLRNIDRPGWAYVSCYPVQDPNTNYLSSDPDPAKRRRYEDEMIAVKLDGSGQVERLGRTHSLTSVTGVCTGADCGHAPPIYGVCTKGLIGKSDCCSASDCAHGSYRSEKHCVPLRDGVRVICASNWLLDCLTCDPNAFVAIDGAGNPTWQLDVQAYVFDSAALRTVPYNPTGGGRQIWVIEAALWVLALEAAV